MASPFLTMAPEENVYTYLLFMIPIEQAKAKSRSFSWGIVIACLVVLVSVTLQAVLLWNIFNSIVVGDLDWQVSVYKTVEGCNNGGSLCTEKDGIYSCAPPSVQLASQWDTLDTDGDGIWTREEVEAAKEDLKCKFNVNPVEVFDVFVKMAVDRENVLWIHPDVKAGKALPKAYFTFAAGDVIMCTYRTTDLCPNLLLRDTWDAPLKNQNSPRVGNSTGSALDYCYELLKPGGKCERWLPSTYSVWKKNSEQQCYGAGYTPATYAHPLTKRTKTLLAVDYGVIGDYSRSVRDHTFRYYKACVIGMYLMAMFSELRAIVRFANLTAKFPSAWNQDEGVSQEPDADDPSLTKYTINGITKGHRICMVLLVILRLFMLVSLTVTGLMFLLKTMSVLDLILNGLGLLFVVDIASMVFAQMLNPALKEEFMGAQSLQVPMLGNAGLNRNPALKDVMWFIVLVGLLFGGMMVYKVNVTDPTTVALNCACLSNGEQCKEAQIFGKSFWTTYWNEAVPEVFETVKGMEAEYQGQSPPMKMLNARRVRKLKHRSFKIVPKSHTHESHS